MPLAKQALNPHLKFPTTDPLALRGVGALPILAVDGQQLPYDCFQSLFLLKGYIPKRVLTFRAIRFSK